MNPSGWLNVPHCKQEFHHSCLAACIRMVLAHHGRDLPEADLRQFLDTKPSGAFSAFSTAPTCL